MVPGIVQFFKDWICPVQRQIRLQTETETGQLVCYLTRTTPVLPTRRKQKIDTAPKEV